MRHLLVLAVFSTWLQAMPLPTGDLHAVETEMYGTPTKGDYEASERKLRAFEADARDMGRIAERTDAALNAIFHIAVLNLKNYDFDSDAANIKSEWKKHHGELQRIVAAQQYRGYDIGDFKGLIGFIDSAYATIESKLGYQLTHTLRIDDLLTLNKVNVIFNPCTYGEYEFTAHFCGDKHVNPGSPHPHRGFLPVVSFWCTDIACGVMTFGAGIVGMVCGPVAMLVEWGVDSKVAPWLEPKIYHKACGYEAN